MATKYQKIGMQFSKEINGNNYCEVSVNHRKAGYNCFNGKYEEAGIEVCVNPVKREVRGGIVSTSFMIFQNEGFRVLVEPMVRFSQKKFDSVVERVKTILPNIVEYIERDEPKAAIVSYIYSNVTRP